MEKKALRTAVQEQLKQLTYKQYDVFSNEIQQQFLSSSFVREANVIGMTISMFPEVETRSLIEQLWALGKSVAVPKCRPATSEMDFYIIHSFEQLETVYMNLLEPIPQEATYVEPTAIDLVVVPGIVYDQTGYRIGYGGGYYDRFLPLCHAKTISFCFEQQIVAKVPKNSYDYPIDGLLTERRFIPCKQIRKEENYG
ncbi:5-formyltetrahydrofolate cyclo-ligase [Kurthia senegalensis]|uniref:5-formyltetrahydrofolate cyclo-ligase n=1 Tax=Kurthia senegalensis TaxID=1033740 RepID=UPI000287D8F1|nr:5-formyltetrahydrofolate cyclo-ligase [Kurthia senegalensis]